MLFDTTVGDAEIEAAGRVLGSGWLSMGSETQAFEQEFAATMGTDGAVAVSSGTAALHLAVLALELGAGDEVIMPSLSFVASAAVVALVGARPIFADIKSLDDPTIAPDDVARRVTPRTKAIVAMHYGGYATDMAALRRIAQQHGLFIIEDAAHAPAVKTASGMLGALGDVGCFSFFATKNVTTGEGGMVVARNPELLQRIRLLRSHCMTSSSWDRHWGRAADYDVVGLGLNYRPTEIASAIGRCQLTKLSTDRDRRRWLAAEYHSLLADLPGISLPFSCRRGEESAHHLLPIILPVDWSRDRFRSCLRTAGIQSSVHYPPIHLFTQYRKLYGYQAGSLPITEDAASREVTLPLHARMTKEQIHLVVNAVREGCRSAS
jgi:dTDP-4-amino-4,6-dideoxygalactose transaminase